MPSAPPPGEYSARIQLSRYGPERRVPLRPDISQDLGQVSGMRFSVCPYGCPERHAALSSTPESCRTIRVAEFHSAGLRSLQGFSRAP